MSSKLTVSTTTTDKNVRRSDIVNDDGFGDEELDESSNFGVDRLMMFNGVEEPPFLKMGLEKSSHKF